LEDIWAISSQFSNSLGNLSGDLSNTWANTNSQAGDAFGITQGIATTFNDLGGNINDIANRDDIDQLSAAEIQELASKFGDFTVDMNSKFGNNGQDWSNDWNTVNNSIGQTAAIADQLKNIDWDNIDKDSMDA